MSSKFIDQRERPRRQATASYARAVSNVLNPMRSSPLRISA
jgi:hypothetical protein